MDKIKIVEKAGPCHQTSSHYESSFKGLISFCSFDIRLQQLNSNLANNTPRVSDAIICWLDQIWECVEIVDHLTSQNFFEEVVDEVNVHRMLGWQSWAERREGETKKEKRQRNKNGSSAWVDEVRLSDHSHTLLTLLPSSLERPSL